jgi:hypothetical protein
MRKFVDKNFKVDLTRKLAETDAQLAELNKELADKMILLAEQTDDPSVLIQAVQALKSAKKYYNIDTAPRETLDVHAALADTLLSLGRKTHDLEALENSVAAYRSAITLASLIGDEDRRRDIKAQYRMAITYLGQDEEKQSLFKVA